MLRGRLIAILAAFCAVLVVLPAASEARSFGARMLKRGTSGSDVKTLQKFLTAIGYRASADGYFGRGTYRVVRSWESAAEQRVDGRVTRREARTLRAAVASQQTQAAVPQATETPSTLVAPAAPNEALPSGAGSGGASFVQVEAATLNPDGTATPPASAPEQVKQIILAGNVIAKKPYVYGGGHGEWNDEGYDCSGSVSYALHGAGLLNLSLDSGSFMSWGAAGVGTWVTIYAHGGHAYMTVAGLRFDTNGASSRAGSRWTNEMRSSAGFTIRHPVAY